MHKFHHYWRKVTTKEPRLCFFDSSPAEDADAAMMDALLAGGEKEERGTSLRDFVIDHKDIEWEGGFSLGRMVEHLLSKDISHSNADREKHLRTVITDVADHIELANFQSELNVADLDEFADIARKVGIDVTHESLQNAREAKFARTPNLPPPPEQREVQEVLSEIEQSIEKIKRDGQWHPATMTKEKLLGLQYCILPTSQDIYRCDTSGKWVEKWNSSANRWDFSHPGQDISHQEAQRLWAEHNDYIEGEQLRKQNATVTGVRRYGSVKQKDSKGVDLRGQDGRPVRKYYIKLNQPYANYIADPDEKEKYLAIPRDGMWHNYNDLDFREGYQKDPKMMRWQYRLFTDGFMYARQPVRIPGKWGWNNRGQKQWQEGRLSWRVMGYSWNADGSAQWVTPDQATVARVLNETMDMSPKPINDRWAQFDRKKMHREHGYYR